MSTKENFRQHKQRQQQKILNLLKGESRSRIYAIFCSLNRAQVRDEESHGAKMVSCAVLKVMSP